MVLNWSISQVLSLHRKYIEPEIWETFIYEKYGVQLAQMELWDSTYEGHRFRLKHKDFDALDVLAKKVNYSERSAKWNEGGVKASPIIIVEYFEGFLLETASALTTMLQTQATISLDLKTYNSDWLERDSREAKYKLDFAFVLPPRAPDNLRDRIKHAAELSRWVAVWKLNNTTQASL